MTRRNTGGILSATEQATDANSANGIFTLSEAAALTASGNFPVGSFTPNRSARFRSVGSTYLTRTPTTSGNRTTWTWSAWVKRGALGATDYSLFAAGTGAGETTDLSFTANGGGDALYFRIRTGAANAYLYQSSQLLRDPSGWYHIVCAVDTTQAIATNRVKLYVNNSPITSFSTSTTGSQNATTYVNHTVSHTIGQLNSGAYFDGYLSEVNLIDGQQLTPSAFGQTDAATGTWVPKRYTGSYGTNGCYLPFNLEGTNFSADYLVVAGGGGGGGAVNDYNAGGGGGAGGLLTGTTTAVLGTFYTITVGGGGAGGPYSALGTAGSNSVFTPVGTVYGGGIASCIFSPAATGGGSGGGGGTVISPTSYVGGKGVYPGSSYISATRQGYDGGDGQQHVTGASPKGAAGGGGAGGAGVSSTSTGGAGQAGGPGVASSLSGSSVTYAGGGGGGGSASAGAGGAGNTAGVGSVYNGNGGNAAANLGGGGGGAARNNSAGSQTGGNGGSGVIIIKIPSTQTAYFSSGVTFSGGTPSGGFKTYIVTATSTTSETVIFA